MDINQKILEVSQNVFHISFLKPYQLLVMSRIVQQDMDPGEVRNQIVILPTGTGKSLCFLVPSLICKGITIIVYPLLALMNDQIRKLKESNVDCVDIRGGQSKEERTLAFEKLRNGKVKIIVTNPETLNQKNVIKEIGKLRVSLFVCDEAHVISKWGNEFRPDYMKLGETVRKIKPAQIVAFTATASKNTISDISKCLFATKPLVVRGDADRENIKYYAYKTLCRDLAVNEILSTCKRPALVFCPTRETSETACLRAKANHKEIPMRYYHAGLTKQEREKIENWFFQSQDGVLFCTSAYGMGIDKSSIRTVIHYSLPDSIEDYLQQSGRAGRDGFLSIAYAILTIQDCDKENKNEVELVFTGTECRRKALLKVLNQEKEECTGCDICDGKTIDKPTLYNTIIGAVKRYPLRYDVQELTDLLCSRKMNMFNPYRGLLSSYEENVVLEAVKNTSAQMIELNYKLVYPRYKNLFYNALLKVAHFADKIRSISGKIHKRIRNKS